MNPAVARTARKLADQQSARLADLPTGEPFYADITAVTPTLTVLWRGGTYAATGSHASYTPTIGDRVECHLVRSQLCVIDKIVAY